MTGLHIDPASPAGMVVTDSGLIVPEAAARAARKPTAVDLFCGAGGFSLGVIRAGYEVVCAVEHEPWAAITYLTNLGQWPMRIHFPRPEDEARLNRALVTLEKHRRKNPEDNAPNVWLSKSERLSRLTPSVFAGSNRPRGQTPVRSFIFGDIRDVTAEMVCWVAGIEIGELDAIFTSPPCQGFSTANRNAGPDDPRNLLAFEAARLIRDLRPRSYCLENVPRFAKMVLPHGPSVMDTFIEIADGWSSADTLRRSMLGMQGARAAVRRQKRQGKQDEATPGKRFRKTKTPPSLFGEGADVGAPTSPEAGSEVS